jgi:hypothetical protein
MKLILMNFIIEKKSRGTDVVKLSLSDTFFMSSSFTNSNLLLIVYDYSDGSLAITAKRFCR